MKFKIHEWSPAESSFKQSYCIILKSNSKSFSVFKGNQYNIFKMLGEDANEVICIYRKCWGNEEGTKYVGYTLAIDSVKRISYKNTTIIEKIVNLLSYFDIKGEPG